MILWLCEVLESFCAWVNRSHFPVFMRENIIKLSKLGHNRWVVSVIGVNCINIVIFLPLSWHWSEYENTNAFVFPCTLFISSICTMGKTQVQILKFHIYYIRLFIYTRRWSYPYKPILKSISLNSEGPDNTFPCTHLL